jgi:hypothetical protein
MLYQFLRANQQDLVERCRAKVAVRRAPRPTEAELEHGIPLFLQQFIDMLQAHLPSSPATMLSSATQHGDELRQKGFTVAQVIHDYGDLCQAITELAVEREASIRPEKFGALNRCLDDAIAAAVTEHVRQREELIQAECTRDAEERLALLAHELRNLLHIASLSFEVIKRGRVAINGTTGALHERALRGLSSLIDRALAEARFSAGIRKEQVHLDRFIEDVELAAGLEADALEVHLSVSPVDPGVAVHADPEILASVLANLLQNAFKFTRQNGCEEVSLRVRQDADRVFIEVEDQCGGLEPGAPEELFRPLARRRVHPRPGHPSGLGLGLTICQRGVEANDGELHVRSLPGKGCVFSVELERTASRRPGTESAGGVALSVRAATRTSKTSSSIN